MNLIDQLGSVRYADREAAARALERLGKEALPALHLGSDSRDMEIRTRAAAILRKIEGSLLSQPTMVRLDFHDTPLPEVVARLSQQTGMKISLFPENLPRWKAQRVSLREPEPIPFWKAVDRLCFVASLQNDLELHGVASGGEARLSLTDRMTRPVQPVSDHGPFRVGLVGLEFQRHVGFAIVIPPSPRNPAQPHGGEGAEFAPPRPRAVTSVQCSVQFQLMAEPRLGVSQSGPLRIIEARDDLGNSLAGGGRGDTMPARDTTYLGGTCSSVLHLRASLDRPEHPGRSIKTLRGEVPLRVAARRPDPLIVPLAGAAGKTFQQGDLQLTVHQVRSDPDDRRRQIELSVRLGRHESSPPAEELSAQDPSSRLDPTQHNIEIVDSQDHVLSWFQTSVDAESSRITLTMTGPSRAAEPKELRYYRLSEAMVSVPFCFRDVPMP
jgi:hypothetical protein